MCIRDTVAGRANVPEQRLRESRGEIHAAHVVLHDRAAGDIGIRALVDLLVEAVEGVVDRVGENVGAAHHGDSEHDRDGGQARAQLAGQKSAQSDPDHWTISYRSPGSPSGSLPESSPEAP